jgi:Protein of unknown function (DUF669)
MSLNIDLSGVTEQGSPIPDGTYSVIIDKAELTPTKTGGEMIKVQFKVKEGPSTGRVIFEQFNIKNTSAQAVQIGLGQLKGMMKAFGHPNVNKLESTKELVGLKGLVAVQTKDDNSGYGPQTKVKAYKPHADAAQTTAAPAADGATQSPPAANANPFG